MKRRREGGGGGGGGGEEARKSRTVYLSHARRRSFKDLQLVEGGQGRVQRDEPELSDLTQAGAVDQRVVRSLNLSHAGKEDED